MTDQEFHHTISWSARSRGLLSATIRAAAKARLGVPIDHSTAETLARIHTLETALQTLQTKLVIHGDLPVDIRNALAVQETSVEGPFGLKGNHRDAAIIDLRRTTLAVASEAESDDETSLALQRQLWQVRQAVGNWALHLRRFLVGFQKLYDTSMHELANSKLSPITKAAAKRDLDQLYGTAVDGFCRSLNGLLR